MHYIVYENHFQNPKSLYESILKEKVTIHYFYHYFYFVIRNPIDRFPKYFIQFH